MSGGERHRVFITGGASGIGLAIGRAFLAAGHAVTLADRNAERAEQSAAELQAEIGGERRAWSCFCDVVEAEGTTAAVERSAEAMGGLDAVIANAGVGVAKPFLEITPEEFEQVHAVNIRGVFHTLQAGARALMARDGGSLLVNASVTALRASAYRGAYGSSKAAAMNLAQIAAIELAPHGVRCNVICPGPVSTPLARSMHSEATQREWLSRLPMGRYGTPEEIAGIAVFLASPAAAYITGQAIAVDGGWSATGLMPPEA